MTNEIVKGLEYVANYLKPEEQSELLQYVNQQVWDTDLQRRVQHYGYRYDYKARNVNHKMKLGELPEWVIPIAHRLERDGYTSLIPDQLIINEYKAGQGIAPHIDCKPCFKETIISLSLGSTCMMNLTHIVTQQKVDVFLELGSLVVLQNEARYDWKHGIAARKTDTFNGSRYERGTRVSLTFRNIIL